MQVLDIIIQQREKILSFSPQGLFQKFAGTATRLAYLQTMSIIDGSLQGE